MMLLVTATINRIKGGQKTQGRTLKLKNVVFLVMNQEDTRFRILTKMSEYFVFKYQLLSV